jgi:hypothetical protein
MNSRPGVRLRSFFMKTSFSLLRFLCIFTLFSQDFEELLEVVAAEASDAVEEGAVAEVFLGVDVAVEEVGVVAGVGAVEVPENLARKGVPKLLSYRMNAFLEFTSLMPKKILLPHATFAQVSQSMVRGAFLSMYAILALPVKSNFRVLFICQDADSPSGKTEYRIWNPYRSKLGAAIIGGIGRLFIQPGCKLLYLGAASGTTVSHCSDIVGPVRN